MHSAKNSRGFTLTEVIIAMTLGSMILAGVLSMFVMLVKTGVRTSNYSTMETETRRAFEQLGIDARMANNIVSNFSGGVITYVTLTIPSNDLTTQRYVMYGYETDPSATTYYRFYIADYNPTTSAISNKRILVRNVTSFTFLRYNSSSTLIPTSTTSDAGVKHIQVSLSVSRSTVGVVAATQVIRSSAFTLRNISI